MYTSRSEAVSRFWSAFDALSQVRDPLASLLHPYAFGQGENIESRLRAARFVLTLPRRARRFVSSRSMRDWCVAQCDPDGLFLEFGVGSGQSTNQIAVCLRQIDPSAALFGFDSFRGLPEDWRKGVEAGEFAQSRLPRVEENVTLVVGPFQDTLPSFLAAHREHVSFLHVDSDLYSSAKFVLSTLLGEGRLRPGSVVLFDELFNYPGWFRGGEYRALRELLPTSTLTYEFVGVTPLSHGTVIKLLERR
jgi:Methyltransferase domain